MIEKTVPPRPGAVLRLSIWVAAPIIGAVMAPAAQAGPFKQNMQRMSETTKAAKGELGAFDPGNAAALLQQYVQEAQEGKALTGGDASAKTKDLYARFARLGSTAENGATAVTSQAQFRRTFLDIAAQCKSCHSVYKN